MKIPVRFPLKTGVRYYTSRGEIVQIYFTRAGGDYPVHGAVFDNETREWVITSFTTQGQLSTMGESARDIVSEEWKASDKELVWCWEKDMKFGRQLGIFDAKNNCTFDRVDGKRGGTRWRYYAPFDGEYPEWAKEAIEKLED